MKVSLIGDYRQQREDQGSSWGRFVTSAREGKKIKNTKEGQHDREGYYGP